MKASNVEDLQEALCGNKFMNHADMRGMEGNSTATLYANICDVRTVVGTVRLKNAGAAT